ncbi:hypothetical protein IAR55_005161 [Kwoniella newhampshirensis]|uniref:M protein repeat protein n=1 Tax=Kwoniella newhampshirensis TaxID=1651941 RepID=A0AAW0YXA5_9TREE
MADLASPISDSISLKTLDNSRTRPEEPNQPSEKLDNQGGQGIGKVLNNEPASGFDNPHNTLAPNELTNDDAQKGSEVTPAENKASLSETKENGHDHEVVSESKSTSGEAQKDSKPVETIKAAAGGVKKVLKSGVFGNTPQSKPASKGTPPAATATKATRVSLAPARQTSSTARPSAMTSRPGQTSRLSQSTSARPPVAVRSSTNAMSRPRETTRVRTTAQSSDRMTSSSITRPGASASATAARPRPSVKPSVPTATTARMTVTRPSTTTQPSALTTTSRSEPLKTTTANRAAVTAPSGPSPAVKPRATRPLTGRSSIAPTSATSRLGGASNGTAQKPRPGSGPSALAGKTDNGKEVTDLKTKVAGLEKKLTDATQEYETKVAQSNKEKLELEEKLAKDLEELRAELDAAKNGAGTDTENKIDELKQLHEAELKAANEQRYDVMKEMGSKLSELAAARATVGAKLSEAQHQLADAQTELRRVTNSLATAEAESSQLRQASQTHASTLAEVEAAKLALEEKVHELEQARRKLEAELSEGAEEAEKSIVGITGLEGQVKEFESQIAQLEQNIEMEQSSRKADGLKWKKEVEGLTREVDSFRSASEGHAEALNRVSSETQARQEDLQALQAAHDQLSSTHADLLQTSSRHPEELATLQAQIKQVTDKYEASIFKLKDENSEMIVELEKKLSEASEGRKAAETELASVKEKLEEIELELQELSEVRRAMEGKETKLNEIIAGLEANTENLNAEFDTRSNAAYDEAKRQAHEEHAKQLADIRSDLATTQEMAEMNKSHFEQSFALMREQHAAELASAAEGKTAALASVTNKYDEELALLHDEIHKLQLEAQNAKIEKDRALSQLADRTRTPPASPPTAVPRSPPLTKLHEAHNAKVTEMENEIRRLQGELAGFKAGHATGNNVVHPDEHDETLTF